MQLIVVLAKSNLPPSWSRGWSIDRYEHVNHHNLGRWIEPSVLAPSYEFGSTRSLTEAHVEKTPSGLRLYKPSQPDNGEAAVLFELQPHNKGPRVSVTLKHGRTVLQSAEYPNKSGYTMLTIKPGDCLVIERRWTTGWIWKKRHSCFDVLSWDGKDMDTWTTPEDNWPKLTDNLIPQVVTAAPAVSAVDSQLEKPAATQEPKTATEPVQSKVETAAPKPVEPAPVIAVKPPEPLLPPPRTPVEAAERLLAKVDASEAELLKALEYLESTQSTLQFSRWERSAVIEHLSNISRRLEALGNLSAAANSVKIALVMLYSNHDDDSFENTRLRNRLNQDLERLNNKSSNNGAAPSR